MMNSKTVFCLPGFEDFENVGQKAKRIIAINNKGFNIPKTLLLPFGVFDYVLDFNGLIPSKLGVNNIVIPEDLKEEIEKFYNHNFYGIDLVVRSSSLFEDSPFFSCSGQYESFLYINSFEKLIKSIISCYASITSRNAQDYIKYFGLNLETEKMGILIQELIQVDISGVVFTVRPPNNFQEIIIEYTAGLGDKLVGGKIIPEQIIIDRSNLSVLKEPWLSLVNICMELEKTFSKPQDIEWGWCSKTNSLYLFQSRDITISKTIYNTIDKNVVYPGIVFGHIDGISKNSCSDRILLIQEKCDGIVSEMIESIGIIIQGSGMLSHICSVIRELKKPCVLFDKIDEIVDGDYILDALRGRLLKKGDILSNEHKDLIWEWASGYIENIKELALDHYQYTLDRKHLGVIREPIYEHKYEGVIFDSFAVKHIKDYFLDINLESYNGIQEIVPFNTMISSNYCISARVQRHHSQVRVQIKKNIPFSDNFRKDEEILFYFNDFDKAIMFLESLFLIRYPKQERVLDIFNYESCIFKFMRWPSSKEYLGIESSNRNNIISVLNSLNLNTDIISCVDGKQIFSILGMKLENNNIFSEKGV